MKPILDQSRRPDITFCRNGRIFITARVSRILGISPGDSINIAYEQGECLLYVIRHPVGDGRHIARCFPTNKRSRNFSANSVTLCRAMLRHAAIHTDRISFMVGETLHKNTTDYLTIITRRPL